MTIDVISTADTINVSNRIVVTSIEPTNGTYNSILSQCGDGIIHVDFICIFSYSWCHSSWNCFCIDRDNCDNRNIMLLS